jgi:hypothetical protein
VQGVSECGLKPSLGIQGWKRNREVTKVRNTAMRIRELKEEGIKCSSWVAREQELLPLLRSLRNPKAATVPNLCLEHAHQTTASTLHPGNLIRRPRSVFLHAPSVLHGCPARRILNHWTTRSGRI